MCVLPAFHLNMAAMTSFDNSLQVYNYTVTWGQESTMNIEIPSDISDGSDDIRHRSIKYKTKWQ